MAEDYENVDKFARDLQEQKMRLSQQLKEEVVVEKHNVKMN